MAIGSREDLWLMYEMLFGPQSPLSPPDPRALSASGKEITFKYIDSTVEEENA